MDPSSLDLNLLVTLHALLEEGSVTRAAARVGLSTPAMSHALARLREQIKDPVLVRAGRTMVLTARAQGLKPRVGQLVAAVRQVMSPDRPFDAHALTQTFRIHATDHAITVLGRKLDQLVAAEAPRACLQFLPNVPDDSVPLRAGSIDLAIGIWSQLPPEMRIQRLFGDRFVCVVRANHPAVGKKLTLEQFVALAHVQIAPRGRPGGPVDELLAERGLKRHIARVVPYFLTGLLLVASADYILTVSARVAHAMATRLGLRVLESPLPMAPYALSQLWHPRNDGDPAHKWLRDVLLRAAKAAAPEKK